MFKGLIRFLLGVLSVVFICAGLLILTVRLRAFDPDTYKLALAPSGVYKEFRFQLEEFLLANYAATQSKESAIELAILEEIDFKSFTVPAGERNIDNIFSWLNQEQTPLGIYIPRQAVTEKLSNPEIRSNISSQLDALLDQLPPCPEDTQDILAQTSNSPDLEMSDLAVFPACIPSGGEVTATEVNLELEKFFTKLSNENFVDKVTGLAEFTVSSDETNIMQIQSQLPAKTRLRMQANLETVRNLAETLTVIGWTAIIIGIVMLLLVIFLKKFNWRNMLLTISTVFILAGLLTLIVAYFGNSYPETMLEYIPEYILKNSQLTPQMAAAAKNFHTSAISKLFEMSLYTGGAVSIIGSIVFLAAKLMPKTKGERRRSTTIGQGLPTDDDLAPKLKPGLQSV